MTFLQWVNRVVSVLLALALLLGSLLALVEIVLAALDRPPWLVDYPEWGDWLRSHSWNDRVVIAVLIGMVVLGLLLLLLALRRGRPATLPLNRRTDGVDVTVSRRSLEKTLAAAASRTTGVAAATTSAGRRTVRVDVRAASRDAPEVRAAVGESVTSRLESLGLADRMRSRVRLRRGEAR